MAAVVEVFRSGDASERYARAVLRGEDSVFFEVGPEHARAFFAFVERRDDFTLSRVSGLAADGCVKSAEDAGAMCKCLSRLRSLRSLRLRDCALDDVSMRILEGSFLFMRHLDTLDLSSSFVKDIHLMGAVSALSRFTKLRRLTLDNNQLRDRGALIVGENIPYFLSLQHLSVRCNDVGDDGADLLVGYAGAACPRFLDLGGNALTPEGKLAISNKIKPGVEVVLDS